MAQALQVDGHLVGTVGLDFMPVASRNRLDVGAGEQFSDAYRALNPDCVVPTLQLDDGSCLSEVVAICDYLESRFPEPPLFGTNDAVLLPTDAASNGTWLTVCTSDQGTRSGAGNLE